MTSSHWIDTTQCDSTQTLAKDALMGDSQLHHVTVVSARQLHGMGRHGRVWVNPPGDALMMSLASRGPYNADVLNDLPRRILGLVCAACDNPPALTIVDPNDLYLNGHKVGGALIDARTVGREVEILVVGIGLNLTGPQFAVPQSDGSGEATATTFQHEGVAVPDAPTLARHIARAWQASIDGYVTAR